MIRIVSIDIGTSAIKAAVFEKNKLVLTTMSVPLPEDSPKTPLYWIEAIEEIMTKFRQHINKTQVKHLFICISGHGPSTVYVDKHNEAIHYTSWLKNEVVEIPGGTSKFLPQIVYVRDNMEEIYRNTVTILPPAEYICFLLLGLKYVFIPNKNLLPFVWTEQSIYTEHLDSKKMPPPMLSGKVLGRAYMRLGKKLNISHGSVVSGGLDYISAIIGSGNMKPHSMLQRSGSSVTLNISYPKALEKIQLKDSINTVSFNMPGVTSKYNNAGNTVAFFDIIYKKIYTYIDLQNTDYIKIISYIQKHQEYIIPYTISVVENIINANLSIDEVHTMIQANIKKEYLGFSYIILLLELLKHSQEKLHPFVTIQGDDAIGKNIIVSGGHAKDRTLMFLEANYLKTSITTYNPTHLELYGNVCFALIAAFPKQSLQKLADDILFEKQYNPQKH